MVSVCPPIPNTSNPLSKALKTVPNVLIIVAFITSVACSTLSGKVQVIVSLFVFCLNFHSGVCWNDN